MRSRTRAREVALKYLYEFDVNRGQACLTPEAYLDRWSVSPSVREYARTLMEGVLGSLEALNGAIAGAAENWRLERMAAIDRNLLRIGAWEILASGGAVPGQVAINEAVELAKRYGTERSGSFVNGILDKILSTASGPAGGPAKDDDV